MSAKLAGRRILEGLPSTHPIADSLPALLQADDFAQRFCGGLDEILAPVLATLDNLNAYFDPDLAPEDFVMWLGTWFRLNFDPEWPLDRRRALVDDAVELVRWRSTLRGMRALIRAVAGVVPEITDNGGVSWSNLPGGRMPGSATPSLRVRVNLPKGSPVEPRLIDVLVSVAKPAHIPHVTEVRFQ